MSHKNKRNSWKRKGGSTQKEKADPELPYGVQVKRKLYTLK